MGAMDRQEGGGHYKGMALQPMEFSVRNGWDAAAHTALKYLARFRDKGGLQDLKKATHCLQMRAELLPFYRFTRRTITPHYNMACFVSQNKLEGLQAQALFKLELYVVTNHEEHYHETLAAIEELIREEYGLELQP